MSWKEDKNVVNDKRYLAREPKYRYYWNDELVDEVVSWITKWSQWYNKTS